MQEVLIVTRFDSHPWTAEIKSKRQTVVFCYIEVQYRVYGNILYTCFKAELVLMFQRFTIICFCVIRGSEDGGRGGGSGFGSASIRKFKLIKIYTFLQTFVKISANYLKYPCYICCLFQTRTWWRWWRSLAWRRRRRKR